ncbi:MAG: type I DNA topoisomerase [Rickettsiales bacterium]|nr:type I DNA topoisomerase [Rickettsiales bacterium]
MKNLLIVESPAKAKTIGKYLGKDYSVLASFGHIRDLPSKDGSVDPNNDFAMNYEVSKTSSKHVKAIVDSAKNCDKLILAPDPDREGESIAWHILEVLKKKKVIKKDLPVERVVFNSITKSAVTEAIKKPRNINVDLVNAQQARRALDYLVGFTLSPVLWRKLPGSRSAGRVQSVALRLICDREDEIEAFKTEEYWDIKLDLNNSGGEKFQATIHEIDGKKLEKFSITKEEQAVGIKKVLEDKSYQVLSITKKQSKRRSNPPFTTSSLQQEAARKLGFGAKKTMMVAQKLYEGVDIGGSTQGLITYMRTDSISVTPEVIGMARDSIKDLYGDDYLPDSPNVFKSKAKNAQEAHEAIRPADFSNEPKKVKGYLDSDQFALYDLIWKRMLASQMADVVFDQVSAEIITIPSYAKAKATGSTIKFDGFYKVYKEGVDEEQSEDDEKRYLPELEEGENLKLLEVSPNQHFTDPPPRYSEASLVKKMEELGIGRPSTYAAIISVLQDRGYVKLDRKRFFPEERGRIVTIFLKEFFLKYVEYDYTAHLEDELDIISHGGIDWKEFLKKFWGSFNSNCQCVKEKEFSEVLDILNETVGSRIFGRDESGKLQNKCPSCDGGSLSLKLGKFGAFVGCSNYPTCKHTKQLFGKEDGGDDTGDKPQFEPRNLGKDPKSGFEVMVKLGPYGPYLELQGSEEVKADAKGKKKKAKKPKRVSIPKNMDPHNIDLRDATGLLTLPREVGIHPETGLKIVASIGPFGPYLLHDKKYSSVKDDNILEIGLNRAVDLIYEIQKKKSEGGGRKKGVRKTMTKKKK